MEEKAKEILKNYNQEHIITWMNSQTEKIKEKISKQVLDIDLDELKELYNKVQRGTIKKDYNITPLHSVIRKNINKQEEDNYIALGEKVLKSNKYAVVTMAGGQGTRLRT